MQRAEPQPNLIKPSASENLRLREPLKNIRGLDVYDSNGEEIGSVEDLFVDQEAQFPRFLDVGAGGFLGIGKKHFLVPFEEVSRHVSEEERVIVRQNREKVLGSPDFDPDEMPEVDLQRAVYAYYGYS
jgi:sporulation protein YlmC with PRC-barrel domain